MLNQPPPLAPAKLFDLDLPPQESASWLAAGIVTWTLSSTALPNSR